MEFVLCTKDLGLSFLDAAEPMADFGLELLGFVLLALALGLEFGSAGTGFLCKVALFLA